MFKINYKITVGSVSYTPNSDSKLIRLRVNSSTKIPVNCCSIDLTTPQDLSFTLGDTVSIELGYDQQTTKVFTGLLTHIKGRFDRLTLTAESSFKTLIQSSFNLLFEKSNASDIVQDIASNRLKLKVNKADTGLKFPVYSIGHHKTAYDHLFYLAKQCGFELYANHEDQLFFAEHKAETTHSFNYGETIISLITDSYKPSMDGIAIYGESPAGQGDDAVSWLAKKEIKGISGKTSGVILEMADSTAKTVDLASKIASGYLSHYGTKNRGSIQVLGEPKIKLGDDLKLDKIPVKSYNGTYKITGFNHHLSQSKGFITTITWEG